MKYRSKLLELYFDADDKALMNWLENQPIEEYETILKEQKIVMQEMLQRAGMKWTKKMDREYDELTNDLLEKTLDSEVAEAKYEMATWELAEAKERLNEIRDSLKEEVLNAIELGDAIEEETIRSIKTLIEYEKKSNIYDAAYWQWFYNLGL